MSHDKATSQQVTLFLEDAMTDLATNIRDHELCPECATAAFIATLVKSIEVGLIKQAEDYTDEEKQRLPYFTDAADMFFYNQRDIDDIGDCIGTA
jgi:hypothetical protein